MNKFLAYFTLVALIFLEIYSGVRLLTNPAEFTGSLVMIFGGIMIFIGLVSLLRSLQVKTDSHNLLPYRLGFFGGILDIIIGVCCIVLRDRIVALIPGIMMIIGVIMVIAGIHKVRNYLFLKDIGIHRSWLVILTAILTIILGILIFINPFTATAAAWSYAGYFLIVAGVFDLFTLIFSLIL